MGFIAITIALSVVGIWKRIPLLMFIGGALITYMAIFTDSVTALGDTQTCTTAIATTTCIFEGFDFTQPDIKIMFGILGSMVMIGGALIWKTVEG